MKTVLSEKWRRVTMADPCPVCKKTDWCCVGTIYVNCMRLESIKPSKNGGWLHHLNEEVGHRVSNPAKPVEERPRIDAAKMMRDWSRSTRRIWVEKFALELGVTAESLESIGCACAVEHKAWAFPMKDYCGNIIGIRLRSRDGRKWAVTGSRSGIFIPAMRCESTLFIVEGPTDLAAALSIGLFSIGRPACLGCEDKITAFIARSKAVRVVICSDCDGPGQRGAEKLQSILKIPSVIFTPPAKDIREAVNAGMNSAIVNLMVNQMVWTIPRTP